LCARKEEREDERMRRTKYGTMTCNENEMKVGRNGGFHELV
jgi:hypothetical protein